MSRTQEIRLAIDASRCALCGGPNACALAPDSRAGGAALGSTLEATEEEKAAACWCVSEVFAKSLLDALPTSERGRRCVCRACLVAHGRDASGSD